MTSPRSARLLDESILRNLQVRAAGVLSLAALMGCVSHEGERTERLEEQIRVQARVIREQDRQIEGLLEENQELRRRLAGDPRADRTLEPAHP